MTTATTLAKEYSFTAPVVSRGMRGSNATLEFDWKLPGSKYNLILYERDPEKVDDWNAGDLADVTIAQGNLKDGKDGRYATDYFYDLVSIEAASQVTPSVVEEPPEGQAHPSGKGQVDISQAPKDLGRRTWDATGASIERQVALKAAVELAGYKIAAGKDVGAKEVMQVATLFDRWLGRYFDVDVAANPDPETGELPA
mgnify:CR=1 FL=1